MKKYAYCFGCDGKFGASDGIASARRILRFNIFLQLNTSILGIVNLWLLHFVGTALFFEYWDTVWNTTIRETINVGSSDCDYLWIHCIHTSSGPRLWTSRRVPHLMTTAKLTPGYPGGSALGDGFRTVTVRKSPDPDLTWCPLKNWRYSKVYTTVVVGSVVLVEVE